MSAEVSDASIITAVIATVPILLVPALTFFLTKKKEREAEWRTQKLEHYKAFMAALSAFAGPSASPDEVRDIANTSNNIFLVGSSGVLVALHSFFEQLSAGLTPTKQNELLTNLLVEIRKDIDIEGAPLPPDFTFNLRTSKNH